MISRNVGHHGSRWLRHRPVYTSLSRSCMRTYRGHDAGPSRLVSNLHRPPPSSSTALGFPKPRCIILPPPASRFLNVNRLAHTLDSSLDSPRSTPAPTYKPPTTGLLSRLPPSWVPYAELLRLDKPVGTYYLFFPCLFSTLLAAPLTDPATPPLAVLSAAVLFFSGALIMRGAGCAINDLWDRNLDPHVTRTRLRPLARGAITPLRGVAFVGANLLAGLGVLLQFPPVCLLYGVPSLVLVALYPLAKRVTYYPQFVLGLTFSWGAIMGFPALGVDFLGAASLSQSLLGPDVTSFLGIGVAPTTAAVGHQLSSEVGGNAALAAACLYASSVSWTVLYDMIYAHMDIHDDAKAGIKSIALAHASTTKQVLTLLAAVQVSLLGAAGLAAGAGPAFFVGSCGGAALTLGWMIKRVRLESVNDCWWWFLNGCWMTGGVISVGLGADYLVRYFEAKRGTGKSDEAIKDDETE
ncbi:hypothetical protein DL767_007998 [Monosporascus sp. MG133]|nr:hypothetical protein DL767_007998 [Monosporascus sp. MG133]